jgi:hypothetical protein
MLEAIVIGSPKSEPDDKPAPEAPRFDTANKDDILKHVSDTLNKHHEKTFVQQVVLPLLLITATLIALVVCAILCVPCLMGILVFSACTCSFVPIMNVPLWGAIVLLIIEGWSLTNGHLTLMWN